MAHTRTEYTITAGFGGNEVLVKLGEALFGLGLMGSASGWYDSFTDTGGSEVRILEMEYTGNSGVYNKVYHAYFTSSVFDGLWHTVYYSWDVNTHESGGVQFLDHVSSYEHPDDTTNFSSYYAKIAEMSNASDFKIITYSDGLNMKVMRLTNTAESRLYCFIPTETSLRSTADYSEYGPAPMYTMKITTTRYNVGHLISTDRSVTGRENGGTGSGDWVLSTSYGSHVSGSGQSVSSLSVNMTTQSLGTAPGLMAKSASVRTPYYVLAKNTPAGGAYYDVSFGENFGLISAYNAGAFEPSYGDILVISAGVEEYEVLQTEAAADVRIDWTALVSRIV